MRGMIVFDKLTVLDVRTIFPDINIFLERVLTLELLLKSFRLFVSTIIHYMKGEIIEFHPTCSEFRVDFFIHEWNNMNWLIPNSSFFQIDVKLRDFIVMIATESLNSIREFFCFHGIRTMCKFIKRLRPIYVLIHDSPIIITVLQ